MDPGRASNSPEVSGGNRLIASLPVSGLALLAPHLTNIEFERGTVLQDTRRPVEHVYFLHSGLVSLLVDMPEGYSVEVALIGCEGAVGIGGRNGADGAPHNAVAQAPGSAARISMVQLTEVASRSDAVRDMIARAYDALFNQVQHVAACNAAHDVEARVSRWLLQAHDRLGPDEIPVTQKILADLLHVRRTTVTVVCRKLQMRDVILVRRGRMKIKNGIALGRIACACGRDRMDRGGSGVSVAR
jgi:CRP-like cAMP-binding protein